LSPFKAASHLKRNNHTEAGLYLYSLKRSEKDMSSFNRVSADMKERMAILKD
jgi:hypothetical protein